QQQQQQQLLTQQQPIHPHLPSHRTYHSMQVNPERSFSPNLGPISSNIQHAYTDPNLRGVGNLRQISPHHSANTPQTQHQSLKDIPINNMHTPPSLSSLPSRVSGSGN